MFKLKYLLILLLLISIPNVLGITYDRLENENINVTINTSHINFKNEYLDLDLEHVDFFVPTDLKNELVMVTPCDPNLMVCQGPNNYFHVLNDWTNEYSDQFYLETDYMFNYEQQHWNPGNEIPEGFGWNRINQEIRINYSTNNIGVEEILKSGIDIGNNKKILIDLKSHYEVLIIEYTFINNNETVGKYTDIFRGEKPELLPAYGVVTSRINEDKTTMKYYIDNLYKEERNINITIGYPKDKEPQLEFEYNYEIIPNKYNETIEYLKTISEGNSELKNPEKYDFKTYNVVLKNNTINKYEFKVNNDDNINTLGVWVQGSGSGDYGEPTVELFSAVGLDAQYRWSSDGETWSTTGTTGSNHILSVDWSPELGLFVAVGYEERFRTSEDGKSWTELGFSSTTHFWDVIWAPELKRFVATGNSGQIRLSHNGEDWNSTNIGSNSLYDVAWSPELDILTLAGTGGTSHWSDDGGETWTAVIIGSSTVWTSVEWSPELEIFSAIGGGGAIRWSTNGKTWTTTSAGSTTLDAIAWSPELEIFAAVGRSGAVRWSTDGKSWTTSGTAGSNNLWGVTWSPELEIFVAVGDSGRVYTSTDGKSWTYEGTAGSTTLRDVDWGYQPVSKPNKATLNYPTNSSTNIELDPYLNVTVSNKDGTNMNVSFYNASNHNLIGTNTNVTNNSVTTKQWSDLSQDTEYSWYVNVTNNGGTTQSDIWNFTTQSASDTCGCPGLNNNWEVDMTDYCVITTTCNIGTGTLSFINSGNFTINAQINAENLGDLSLGQTIFMQSNGLLII